MKKRNPGLVLLFTIMTFGIYGIYWQVSTKNELNKKGADIPTAWLIIVPIASLWWIWKYAEGVEKVSNGKTSAVLTLVLLLLLGVIGAVILQSMYNEWPEAGGFMPQQQPMQMGAMQPQYAAPQQQYGAQQPQYQQMPGQPMQQPGQYQAPQMPAPSVAQFQPGQQPQQPQNPNVPYQG